MADDGDVRGFVEIPKLEAGHFVDDDRGGLQLIKDFDSGSADVAN